MKSKKITFILIVILTLIMCWMAFSGQIPGSKYSLKNAMDMRFGIDIRGGVEAHFAPKDLNRAPTDSELEAARAVLEIRLDQNNILDRDVTIDTAGGTILVRFPWKSGEADFDPAQAISELGSMARLTFRDPDGQVVLEGKHVTSSQHSTTSDPSSGYIVFLKLTPEGRQLFSAATERLINQPISIYMDETLISSPTVKTRIDTDECEITNIASLDAAFKLSNQINSGALPFALETRNFSTISPQLGAGALEVMVQAALWTFLLICLALIAYYRLSGVVATISLTIQVAGIVLMIIWTGITVTLSGIAGIILSIGMGVDANIIVSERIREELRSGKGVANAVTTGFRRAFSSVFDGNITVLIVAIVMMWLGSGAMLSFGYTLLFGIIMNFVAGVTATRLMTTSLIRFPFVKGPRAFISDRVREKTETRVFPFFKKRNVFFVISAAIMAFGLIMFFINGMSLDIAFKGGTIVEYEMSETADLGTDEVAAVAETALPDQQISAQIKTEYATGEKRLALSMTGADSVDNEGLVALTAALQNAYPDQGFALASNQSVTSYYSQRFLRNSMFALVLSALLIILYVWFSFRKIHGLSAGVMALLALLHDVLIVFFTFIIFRIPVGGDSFVTVALTILGFSINDTIVIYDRIRENSQMRRGMPVDELVDTSITQSLTRSVNTSLAVFVSAMMIYIFAAANGLDSMRDFALPMAIGTLSGCYSTVVIAGPLWTLWQKHKQAKAKKA